MALVNDDGMDSVYLILRYTPGPVKNDETTVELLDTSMERKLICLNALSSFYSVRQLFHQN